MGGSGFSPGLKRVDAGQAEFDLPDIIGVNALFG
jgi:hypothetical protein